MTRRVLLVTDRPFLAPVDGSAHNYLLWLSVLRDLGCAVSVLSFSRFSARWTADDTVALRAVTADALILDAFPNRRSASASAIIAGVWRCLAGRRYLPLSIERHLRSRQRDRIRAFLREGRFDAIVVNKLNTVTLAGRDLLRDDPAIKLIDMHDNFPKRERLNRQILFNLARDDATLFRAVFKPRDLMAFTTWAGQSRLLREEARLLGMFDHLIFNAAEEADAYEQAGVARSRLSVLPLPGPAERPATFDGARPYQLGLIASDALSNVEGLAFFARHVMPKLRARNVRLLIAGTVGKHAKRLLPPEITTILGWIEDVGAFYRQVEIVLVPLLTGTGVSVKTMEAAAHSAAIVSTTIGARGVALRPGLDIIIADGADAYADAIAALLDDPSLRVHLRQNANRTLRAHHARSAFAAGLERLLQTHAH